MEAAITASIVSEDDVAAAYAAAAAGCYFLVDVKHPS